MAFMKWIKIGKDEEIHLKSDDLDFTTIKDARIKKGGRTIKKLDSFEGALADWAFSDCPSGIVKIKDKK